MIKEEESLQSSSNSIEASSREGGRKGTKEDEILSKADNVSTAFCVSKIVLEAILVIG